MFTDFGCDVEFQRQKTFYFGEVNHPHLEIVPSKDKMPVVELRPFTRKVWRRGKSVMQHRPVAPRVDTREHTRQRRRNDLKKDTFVILSEWKSKEDAMSKTLYAGARRTGRSSNVRLPQVKSAACQKPPPHGFFTIIDREKSTLADTSGAERSMHSVHRTQLQNINSNTTIDMNLEGRCIHPERTVRPLPVDWSVTRSKTFSYKTDFFDGGYSTKFDKNLAQHSQSSSFLTIGTAIRNITAAPLDGASVAHYNYSDSQLVDYTRPAPLDRTLTKITLGNRYKLPNLPAHLITSNRDIIMRTMGPPTHGEVSLKLGLYSNMGINRTAQDPHQEAPSADAVSERVSIKDDQSLLSAASSRHQNIADDCLIISGDKQIQDENFADVDETQLYTERTETNRLTPPPPTPEELEGYHDDSLYEQQQSADWKSKDIIRIDVGAALDDEGDKEGNEEEVESDIGATSHRKYGDNEEEFIEDVIRVVSTSNEIRDDSTDSNTDRNQPEPTADDENRIIGNRAFITEHDRLTELDIIPEQAETESTLESDYEATTDRD